MAFVTRSRSAIALTLLAAASTASSSSAQVTTTYGYDAQGQVVATQAEGRIQAYSYDPAGNRTNLNACDTATPKRRWEAESLPHAIGSSTPGGWRADPANGSGAMSYGPYATDIPSGAYVGVWRVKSSQIAPGDVTTALTLDVWDATAGAYLGTRTVPRSAWSAVDEFQVFSLPFQIPAAAVGHMIELRTWYSPWSTITLDWIGLADQGAAGAQVWSCSTAWEAKALSHEVGEAYGDNWSSNGQQGYLLYGPYTSAIPAGRQTAYWQMMITADTTEDQALAILDVFDSSTGAVLASRVVTAKTFAQTAKWQRVALSYDQVGGHVTEIRARYTPPGRIIFSQAGVIGVTAAIPAAPSAGAVSASTAYNTPKAIALAPSGAYTSLAVASGPSHGWASISGTTATYTPNGLYSGSDSFTYTATGPGGTSAPATVSVTVGAPPPNNPPTANNDGTIQIVAGDTAYVNVVANDSDPDGDTLSIVSLSKTTSTKADYSFSGGTITVMAKSSKGSDSLTYTISDGKGGTATATLSINVTF